MTLAAALPRPALAGDCDQPLAWYQEQGFVVREVRISVPLQFIPSVRLAVQQYTGVIPLKAGQPFDAGLFNAGLVTFKDAFQPLTVGRYARLGVRVFPPPTIQNCDTAGKKLDAVYAAYTMNIGGVLTSLFETQDDAAGRTVTDTGATRFLRTVRPEPFIGYDPARHLFGGTRIDVRPKTNVLDRGRLELSGSGTSLLARASLSGSKDIEKGPLRSIEWTLGYDYTNLPARSDEIRNASVAGQVAVVSAPIGSSGSVFRAGGSVDGGYSRSGFDPRLVRPGDLLNASVGSVKLFAGWSGMLGGSPAKASYGVQLGKAGPGVQLDFAKHVVNVDYAGRYLPVWHRAITLDTAFSAGWIQDLGSVPVGERFFGGNQALDFIPGSTWAIRSNPVVRSLPANRLTQLSGNGLIGGGSFVALNVTAGFTVWGYPLVPDSILRTPKFDSAVKFELSGAQATLYDSYLAEKPAFDALRKATLAAREQLKTVRDALVQIGAPAQIPSLDDDLKDALGICAKKTAKALDPLTGKQDEEIVPTDAIGLFQDFPPVDEGDIAIPSKLQDLAKSLKNLIGQLTQATFSVQRSALSGVVSAWDATLPALAQALTDIEKTSDAMVAHKQAQNEMKFPARVLNRFLYDVNLVGLSPVVLFDAARIGQSVHLSTGETRYAIGGGLKFSFVSLDLTVGYAANPKRKPGEPAGAFVFSLNLADIFR